MTDPTAAELLATFRDTLYERKLVAAYAVIPQIEAANIRDGTTINLPHNPLQDNDSV